MSVLRYVFMYIHKLFCAEVYSCFVVQCFCAPGLGTITIGLVVRDYECSAVALQSEFRV